MPQKRAYVQRKEIVMVFQQRLVSLFCNQKSAKVRARTANVVVVHLRVSRNKHGALGHGFRWIFYNNANGEEHEVTLDEVYAIFKSLPPSISHRICGDHREAHKVFFLEHVLVAPTCCRVPSLSNGRWVPNHISILYHDVWKANKDLGNVLKFNPHKHLVNEAHLKLQDKVDILFDIRNTDSQLPQRVVQNGGLRQRLDGKTGRLRGNLLGKRVNFSARTVLSCDPNLELDQVGIPRSIAQNLSVSVRVNSYNLHQVRSWNIKFVTKNNERFDYSVVPDILIEIGDIVERTLVDGDYVAVNRAPTLHRGSMMSFRIKIFDCSTLRLNLATMAPLNADCDGDELNIHVATDLSSVAEMETLMMASANIVNSQSNKPLIGLSQDELLGSYKLSKDCSLTKVEFLELMMCVNLANCDVPEPCTWSKKHGGRYSGLQLINLILEKLGILLGDLEPIDGVVILDNTIVSGVLNKKVVGASNKGLVHYIFLEYGSRKAAEFIHAMQLVANQYLLFRGFSIGIADVLETEDAKDLDWDGLDTLLLSEATINESELVAALQNVLMMEAPPKEESNLLDMIRSGSKGSLVNFNQIKRCVGAQIDDGGGRINPLFRGRTLPHFKHGENSLLARGHVRNSFIRGLSPHEFFFHAKSGRIGLLDTALKTATTGYQSRKLVKTLEKLVVSTDGTIRNRSTNHIVSFQYGGDSLDPTYKSNIT